MEVLAHGSRFHILCGRYINGYYVCIPNINVRTDVSELTDILWNQEHLETCYPELSKTNIISITRALADATCYKDV